jgi:ABC-type multidrug transport system ATPase subunit
LLTPTSGHARLLGCDVVTDMDKIRQEVGYMSQKFSLYDDLTVRQNIEFYAGLYGISGQRYRDGLDRVVALTNIERYLAHKAKALSGGWKQRLALGCAIIHEPKVIFLDEPTAGIDPVARRDLWDLLFDLSSRGVTMFVTTHYMDEAERCHKVGYVYEGNLIADGSGSKLRKLEDVTPKGYKRMELGCKPLMSGYRFLKKHRPAFEDVTVFGTNIHMLVNEAVQDQEIVDLLATRHITVSRLAEIAPTLEDVFVSLTQRAIANAEAQS